ncbi:hypothetical protein K493DRAFT_295945 [Basidiobolus meristosporus CBS 931.73]|uniref:FHF complex subunit HOOK-interacting protein C-terminal domain-containing protein n=1 Tax=Basidiobolus meristosporus CBS 931.73 TaxID=1314790 RepID=A0A1Y1Z8L7_9FUNG|nr:hypothetical protein K493DRAFT_295945 [Basidiobolus meristosporus CBS 931.73]|eukprot:ORY06620.1 hypothetical protein K493DRAFT_295945 [Basidiobolus meristosporus CBS 931.73]
MGYFAKLKSRILPPKRPHRYERLVHFERNWVFCRERILEEPAPGETPALDAKLTDSLKLLINLLVQEQIRQEDGINGECMEHLLHNDILDWLVNLSEPDMPFGLRGEVIRTISSMISTLDERFLTHNKVHGPTIKLLDYCMADQNQLELYHEDMVDLMFSICSKIRRCPELLNIFFFESVWGIENVGQSVHRSGKSKHEFPIFGYLLRFVHKEGKTGDIARTAMLFLVEITSGELRDYVHAESDLCAVVAAGLGAFYSLLPRKLVVKLQLEESEKAVSHCTEVLEIEEAPDVESTASPEFQDHLCSFVKYLEFTQELLERCPSVRVRNSLLENIRRIFFENILYPSLSECSEMDGSAVAVITYVNVLIQTVYQRELGSILVQYLINMKPKPTETHRDFCKISPKPDALNTVERADVISIDSGTGLLTSIEHKSPSPYNIKEVVINNLKSDSQHIVITTLNLLHTILEHHCHHSFELFEVELVSDLESHDVSIDATNPKGPNHELKAVDHLRVMDLYFSLISRIDSAHDKEGFVQVYNSYLFDVQNQLEVHQEYHQECAFHKFQGKKRREDSESKGYPLLISEKQPNLYFSRHRLVSTDPILRILLSSLSQFFAHSCEYNLALTRVLATLATCPYRCISGWLSFEEHNKFSVEPSTSSVNSIHAVLSAENSSVEGLNALRRNDPDIISVFQILTEHVSYYRSKVPNLDQMLHERRDHFLSPNRENEEQSIQSDLTVFNRPPENEDEFYESDLLSPTSADAVPITGSFLRHVDTYNSTTRGTQNNEIPPIQVDNISSLVDNIIILGETMKELTCIIEVRKSLGADYVNYM